VALFIFAVPSGARAEEDRRPDWTFLTYLNGFNNLDHFGYSDMNEMEKVGSTKRVNVVVQWASLRTKDVRRIRVQKDNDPSKVTSPVLENIGQADMGDYRTLADSIRWAVKNYPAKRYFVNIWNHGNGWHLAGEPPSRDVSYDDLSGNRITTEQLGQVAAEISKELGTKIDIVGSDSCLMAMAEVVAEMKNSIDVFVGSEEVEPADGWPYDRLLAEWNAGSSKSAKEVAEILAKVYRESYPGRNGITLSGLNLEKYNQVASEIRELAEEIKSLPLPNRKKILEVVSKTESYAHDDYKDLGDFIDRLAKNPGIGLREETLEKVKKALGKLVIANETSTDLGRSQGAAIWFPHRVWEFDRYQARYRGLVFNKDTNWIDAIESVVAPRETKTN
jgi:hypothetical protein